MLIFTAASAAAFLIWGLWLPGGFLVAPFVSSVAVAAAFAAFYWIFDPDARGGDPEPD